MKRDLKRNAYRSEFTIIDSNGHSFTIKATPGRKTTGIVKLRLDGDWKYWHSKNPDFNYNMFLELEPAISDDIEGMIQPFRMEIYEKNGKYRELIKKVYMNSLTPDENTLLAEALYQNGVNGVNSKFKLTKSLKDMMSIAVWYKNIPDDVKDEYNLPRENIYKAEIAKIDPTAVDADAVVKMMRS